MRDESHDPQDAYRHPNEPKSVKKLQKTNGNVCFRCCDSAPSPLHFESAPVLGAGAFGCGALVMEAPRVKPGPAVSKSELAASKSGPAGFIMPAVSVATGAAA